MRNITILLFVFISASFNLQAQTEVSGSLNGFIYHIIDNMPGRNTDDYVAPSSSALNTWIQMADSLLNGHYTAAATLAGEVGYELVRLTDGSEKYYILRMKESASNYWGTYVLRDPAAYCRKVVIQSPHPKYDLNTGKEGVYVFGKTKAYFYCLAGTHRCNSSYFSSCTGTTTACSTNAQSYRISDMAHNIQTVFETVTEQLSRHDTSLVFIQLHGFAMRDTDPYVIMSNGTRLTPHPDWLDSLKNALHEADPVLDFKVAHQDISWSRLIAFNNVQGRYLNGSVDICQENAGNVSGHFIHIEQEKSRLREDSTRWEKMATAVTNAFPCVPQGIGDILSGSRHVSVSPNPFTDHTVITYDDPAGVYALTLFSSEGKRVRYTDNIRDGRVVLYRKDLSPGLYFFILSNKKGRRYAGKMVVSD